MISKRFFPLLSMSICFSILQLLSYFKASMLVGSSHMFFSGLAIAAPLAGASIGSLAGLGLFIIQRFLRAGFQMSAFLPLGYYIPTIIASAYWTTGSFLIRFCVPLLCFILFVTHPIGSQAAPYAFYWFIPMILYFVPRKNLFLTALGATFVQHAVGSLFWLYCVPMSAAHWLALMPVVAVERLTFALGMVMVQYAITMVWQTFAKPVSPTPQSSTIS